MAIKRVSAKEAVHLAGVGYVVIDVRTVGEYQKGHPKGALNVPFQRAGRFDLKDNPDFVPILEQLFPDKSQKLLIAGKIGKRSLLAAEALAAAGYTELCELR
ncbi:MAG: rhodanese-like domain-containing protein, partial [Polyangiaceae bacterium]